MDEGAIRGQNVVVTLGRLRKLRIWQLLVGFLLLAVLVLLAVHLYFKWALANYKAELKQKGEKLEVSALIPAMCADEAAVEEAWRILDSFPSVPDGMAKLMEPAGLGKARLAWHIFDVSKEDRDSSEALENFGKAINTEELNLLFKYLEKECLTTGYSFRLDGNIGRLGQVRKVAQALQQLTLWNMRKGNHGAALNCTKAALHVVNGTRTEPVMLTTLVRIACSAITLPSTWELLQFEGWSDADLQSLQACWERQDWRTLISLTDRIERAMAIEFLGKINTREAFKSMIFWGQQGSIANELARAGDSLLSDPKESFRHLAYAGTLGGAYPYWQLFGANRELEMFMKIKQLEIDRANELRPTLPVTSINSSNNLNPPLLSMSFGLDSSRRRYLERIARAETHRDMAIAAIALARYHKAKGRHPESLENLVPHYCAKVPMDWHIAKPLRYRRNSDGTYLLYSIGPDLVDDNGKPAERGFFGMTNDAVWPTPATREEIKSAEEEKARKKK